jgi:hypothetical protein
MTIEEAASTAKAIYLQAAALAGREVGPESPEELAIIVRQGFDRVTHDNPEKKPRAVANLLRLLANTIESPVGQDGRYHEDNVQEGAGKTCPVYPFD